MITRCQGRDEMLGILVWCIGAAAILAFTSPQLLLGSWGIGLGVVAVIAIVLAIVAHIWHGGSMIGAFLYVLFTAGVTIGMMYSIWWYFFIHLASQPLFTFPPIGQTTFSAPTSVAQPHPSASELEITAGSIAPALPSVSMAECGTGTVVEVEALAIRAEPTRSSQQLGAVEQGDQVDLLCEPSVHADEREWYKARYAGIEGWMSARYLDVQRP